MCYQMYYFVISNQSLSLFCHFRNLVSLYNIARVQHERIRDSVIENKLVSLNLSFWNLSLINFMFDKHIQSSCSDFLKKIL